MFCFTLSAQITREQANNIVINHLSDVAILYNIYTQEYLQTGFEIATSNGEILTLDYSCWIFYIDFSGDINNKYLIVKRNNGNLLEINAKNDTGYDDDDLTGWIIIIENPCYCIADELRGNWSWVEKYGGFIGGTWPNSFKSVLKIFSRNEDASINYAVFVEDTLLIKDSFQISNSQQYTTANIKLPHPGNLNIGYWVFYFHPYYVGDVVFWDNAMDGYEYRYRKIRKGK